MTKTSRMKRFGALVVLSLAVAACGSAAPSIDAAAASLVVEVSPTAVTVPPSGQQAFAAAVTGTAETRVTWSIREGVTGGSVANGQYTAPGSPGVFHVVVASVADPTKTATATVTVSSAPPPADTVPPATVAFTARGTASPVQVLTFTGSDSVGVTGYLVTESATPPSAGAASWQSAAPTSYSTASSGTVVLHPWVKDAAGNVSAPFGSPVTLSLTAPVVPATAAKMGTNLNWCADWDPEKMAADLIWCARPFALGAGNADSDPFAPVDARGWPLVASGTRFGTVVEQSPWPGVYKLSFKTRSGTSGVGTVSITGGHSLTNGAYNAATNTTTYDVAVSNYVSGSEIKLMWTAGTGITDVHLMRPLKDGSGWHAIGTPLSDYIIDRLRWFTTIRTMTTQGGESGKTVGRDTNWASRTRPYGPQTASGTGARSGPAIENLVAMANQAQKDLWINVPFHADDDYIRKMAQTIRYGSDGTNPYTSDQANPVFAPLAPNLVFYVEHANEIWNSAPGFWVFEAAAAESANRATTHTDAISNQSGTTGAATIYAGFLAARMSVIFRSVFGDAAMMTRVRPVLAGQHAAYYTIDGPINYINAVWGPTSAFNTVGGLTNPKRPLTYYLYGIATAPYIPSGDLPIRTDTAANVISDVLADLNHVGREWPIPSMTYFGAKAASLGIKFLAYEGGNNLYATTQAARDASFHPVLGAQMGANIVNGLPATDQSQYIYGGMFKAWADNGGDLFVHFTLGSATNLGLCPPSAQSGSDPRLESGPKWDAVKAFSTAWGL